MLNLIEELRFRGLYDNITHQEAGELLNQGKATFYVGFDPTADSFHVGQLAVFNLMRTLIKYGNKPIALMGGGTGMIGDPSGKNAERNLLSEEQIKTNIQICEKQLNQFLDVKTGNQKTVFLNNYDWLSKLGYIEFLRDIGKYFSVNQMMTRDSVSNRLKNEKEGISFTEFSYMLMQAYDFYYLNREYDCNFQLGGSDQWGNIVSGIDLIRRLSKKEAYGLTMPLITKSDGNKFGKSESGAIWLSPEKTSPFEFYQYFLRVDDSDVVKLLKAMTQLPMDTIQDAESDLENQPEKRNAQKLLAQTLTQDVHGKEGLETAIRASSVLYGGSLEGIHATEMESIFKDVPSLDLNRSALQQGISILDLFHQVGACTSKGEARKLIAGKGASLNNQTVQDANYQVSEKDLATSCHLILRKGKKHYFLIRFN